MNQRLNPKRISGYSPDCLMRNLHALQKCSPQLFKQMLEYYNSHRFHVSKVEEGAFNIIVERNDGADTQTIFVPPLDVFPPPLAARYQSYNSKKQWLVIFGIDALIAQGLQQLQLSELSPIILIEPDTAQCLLWCLVRSFEALWSLPQFHIYIGKDAARNFLQDFSQALEPYFITCQGFYLIPSQRFQRAGSSLPAFVQSAQNQFAKKLQEINQIGIEFSEHYADKNHQPTGNVIIIVPAISCWIELGRGMTRGFNDCGYKATEFRVSFPPSSITAHQSLQLMLMTQRLCPDYLATLSHASDMFARGLEQVPIPRLIWYVDQPDHLIQQQHGKYDYLFPFWREFNPTLQTRGGRLGKEIPVGGMPLLAEYKEELSCQVGFVGSAHDWSSYRSQLPDELNKKINALLNARLLNARSSYEDYFVEFDINEKDLRLILASTQSQLRRPGMSDQQIIFFFLNVECTRLHRVNLLCQLHEFDLKIFGNSDWETLLKGTPIESAFQGRGLPSDECRDFYRSADISLSPHPIYPHSGPNPRDMDIIMCGGFALSDLHLHAAERMSEYFEIDQEIAVFDSQHNIADKIRYYLERPDERQAIIQAGQNRIMRDHTYAQRIKQMLDYVKTT